MAVGSWAVVEVSFSIAWHIAAAGAGVPCIGRGPAVTTGVTVAGLVSSSLTCLLESNQAGSASIGP